MLFICFFVTSLSVIHSLFITRNDYAFHLIIRIASSLTLVFLILLTGHVVVEESSLEARRLVGVG